MKSKEQKAIDLMALPDRYNSKAKLYISPISDQQDPYWIDFSDIQMAYLHAMRMVESHPGDWEARPTFLELADRLDELILRDGIPRTYYCLYCSDLEIYVYYAASVDPPTQI